MSPLLAQMQVFLRAVLQSNGRGQLGLEDGPLISETNLERPQHEPILSCDCALLQLWR